MQSIIRVDQRDTVLTLTFDNPGRRNALTPTAYADIREACRRASTAEVSVMVMRGAGGTFAAGTDIASFRGFDARRGRDYERAVDETIGSLLEVPVPVVAVVEGYCLGGGMALACAADLRVVSSDALVGVPIARTLGNSLSAANLALVQALFGRALTLDMLMTGRLLDTTELLRSGWMSRVDDDVDDALRGLLERLERNAPLTMGATKELLRRLHARTVADVSDKDVISRIYGSADFALGVNSFLRGERPTWSGG